MAPIRLSALAFWLALLVVGVVGQRPASKQFQWKWRNDGIGFNLPTCLQLGIEVKSWDVTKNDTHGVPPYYMMAFPIGGTPKTTLIGTDNNTISWTNTFAAGTRMLLTIVDAEGSFGGVPPQLYTSMNGVSANCVEPEPTAPEFTLRANNTGDLKTCEPWGMVIKGGIPPYNISIAAVNSPTITNVTLFSPFDAFTYINRADPGGQMIVAVADYAGRWATGVPLVNTTGSDDTACTGAVSASGMASDIIFKPSDDSKGKNNKTKIIIGVVVPVVVLLLAGLGFFIWRYLRRKQDVVTTTRKMEVDPFNYHTEPLTLPAPNTASVYSNGGAPVGHSKALSTQTSQASLAPGMSSMNGLTVSQSGSSMVGVASPISPTSMHGTIQTAQTGSTSMYTSSSSNDRESLAQRPLGARAPSSKSAEAAHARQQVLLHPGGIGSGADEIVIQHQDGGSAPVVRELPPPYADRTSGV